MKLKGLVRYIDRWGRVTVPAEIWDELDLGRGDAIEIYPMDKGVFICKKGTNITEIEIRPVDRQ